MPIRIGTRGSALALAQAGWLAGALGDRCEIVTIKTRDDAPAEDKSRFTGEIERALVEERIDVAVHSAKDVPSEQPAELEIAAVPARGPAADVWVGPAKDLGSVPAGARIGTASLRRRAQLLAARPDLEVSELRGNVDTRLRRIADGDFDGGVLALAGLRRLGRDHEAAFELTGDVMVPAAGQGSLALQVRRGDSSAVEAVKRVDDAASHRQLACERAAVAGLDASCNTPVGIHARDDDGVLRVRGWCGMPDGSEWVLDDVSADGAPEEVGRILAERLAAAGALELLERAERTVNGTTG